MSSSCREFWNVSPRCEGENVLAFGSSLFLSFLGTYLLKNERERNLSSTFAVTCTEADWRQEPGIHLALSPEYQAIFCCFHTSVGSWVGSGGVGIWSHTPMICRYWKGQPHLLHHKPSPIPTPLNGTVRDAGGLCRHLRCWCLESVVCSEYCEAWIRWAHLKYCWVHPVLVATNLIQTTSVLAGYCPPHLQQLIV